MSIINKADLGVIGLAVMGENLVLNLENKGFSVAVFNRSYDKVENFLQGRAKGKQIRGAASLGELVANLAKPRKIMLMVKAGKPVDLLINNLIEFLEPGDILIDGGNSYYKDTERRLKLLAEKGILYIGAGISGGEEGALHGPSIMPGGDIEAWDEVKDILQAISAKVANEPCCYWVGPGGSGHYVKMVHNGIEYADMQLIAEAYFLLKNYLGLSASEMQAVFAEWNKGELDSYLIEITATILGTTDPETQKPLLELILDEAEQKGTGKWTSQESLELGVPAPTIAEGVFARIISGAVEQRGPVADALPLEIKPTPNLNKAEFVEEIRKALFASKICAYAQGFDLLKKASEHYEWNLNLAEIAKSWRDGCIIRAQFLHHISDAYMKNTDLPNLLLDDYFLQVVKEALPAWRKVVATGAAEGLPLPGFSSALAYLDSLRTSYLWTNLVQAQRDYFGAHTYRRKDKEGNFHTNW